jgi:hypothetical protein
MTQDQEKSSATLPGLEHESGSTSLTAPAGPMELAAQRQVDALTRQGHLEEHHAGLVALTLAAARDIDRSFGRGAPSGRANLLRVMREIFEILPAPVAASQDMLDTVLSALRSDHDEDAPHPAYAELP